MIASITQKLRMLRDTIAKIKRQVAGWEKEM